MKAPKEIQISASIMCIDWLNAGRQLSQLVSLGVNYLHWDIIDGRFAADFTMGSSIISRFRDNCDLPSDYHLMVEEPSRLFDSFEIKEGDIFTIHQECSRNLHRDLINLRRRGAKVGVALSPATPIDTLDYIMEDIDVVLVMTVNPGFKGQKLVPQTIKKIEALKHKISTLGLDIKITVDGNVSFENVPLMVSSGADILVAGSSGLFRDDMSLEEAYRRLNNVILEGLSHNYAQ